MILLNAAESRELDRLSQEKYGIESYALMRRAGEAVADLLLRRWPNAVGGPVLVVAGKGNNGGDGFVAARKLMQAGVRVQSILLATAADLKGDAARAYRDYVAAGGSVAEVTDDGAIGDAIAAQKPIAVVDAIFGIGLNAEVRGLARKAIETINRLSGPGGPGGLSGGLGAGQGGPGAGLGAPVVSIDIASGVNADSGAVMGAAIAAALTVTFGYAKYGHVSYPGAGQTGDLEIAEIGFAPEAIVEIAPRGRMIEAAEAASLLKPRSADSHKGIYGHPLVIAGSRGKSGAAILAARGALRTGAGLVTAAIPESIAAIVAGGQPELMTEPLPDREGHFAAPAAIDELKVLAEGKTALIAGPGIGVSEDTHQLVAWLVGEGAQAGRPLLLDADALNVIAASGPAMLKSAHGPVVLTPHPGEMARLLEISTAAVNADRIGAARRLADLSGAAVLLKGARSVIATPEGAVFVNSSGNAGMATAGMGDVLSGIVGALLGQGLTRGDALALGVYVHGLAADRLAERLGAVGYLAGDLAAELPAAFASLFSLADQSSRQSN
jgi:ADP-dependent NAD(P)H-hydrate dehydratase / NAD(P)H-hydrate epimerase